MKRTPLYEIHQVLGASFAEYGGWELPERFGDPLEEYQAARGQVGIFDLSFRGKLLLVGPDRVRFLQGMVTNDVKHLKEGEGCYAALLTPQGKILADLAIYALPDAFLIDVEAVRREIVRDTLSKYLITDDAEIQDVTEVYGLLRLQGPKAPALLAETLGEPLPREEYHHGERSLDGVSVRLIRRTWDIGGEGYELVTSWGGTAKSWEALWNRGQAFGLQPVGMAALETLRVEAGIPRYGIDMDENTLALEILPEKAISYTKGCYIGQESVARMTYRGHVNKKLVGLKLEGEVVPRPGEKLFAGGKEIGWITSAVFSPSLRCPIALGYVRREHTDPGMRLTVEVGGVSATAEVVLLLFPQRSSA
ncbi:MAG: aminomethyl transferase family protein [candidate division NC10 bacterium]|nr:aminomethyl transferase family protein [candidate division NC10 bacterium]